MKKAIYVIIALVAVALFIFLWQTRTIMYRNTEFRFSFKYSARWEEKYNESTLITLRNSNGSVEINVIARENTEGYSKSVSELGEGYINLLKVFNEEATYEVLSDETIMINGNKTKAQKVSFKETKKGNTECETAVLSPVSNREITITIRGTEEGMKKNEKQINKVIDSIKIY